MKSTLPKVMHRLAGRPMINHLLDTVSTLAPQKVVVVVGPGMDAVIEAVAPYPSVVQSDRLGTGHAVAQARRLLEDFAGTVLVLYGDTPLIGPATLAAMVDCCRRRPCPSVVVLGFRAGQANEYGRLVIGPAGGVDAIIEYKDATPAEQALPLCNSGVMAVDGTRLFGLIDRLGKANAKGEYYLTDIVGLARADGGSCGLVEGEEEELLGINSRADLAMAEAAVQTRLRSAAMANGATLTDPASVHLCWDTRLGRDVTIAPQVVFGPGVSVGDRVEIRSFCHLEGATIGADAIVGPFARLRPGARIDGEAHVGNFVEIKNAHVEAGAKVNHLAYVGDARVGAGANVGRRHHHLQL